MAVEGVLTGWIEMVSSTKLIRRNDIEAAFRKLADDNPSLEIVRLESNDDEMVHADITCWDEPAPNFIALLRPIADLLEPEEYMYFEEKVKFGHRGRTLRALLVSGAGIFKAEQDALILLLQERNRELHDDDASDDAENFDEDDENFDEDESTGDDAEPIEDPEIVM